MTKKIRLGVLFGGRSAEHEVSLTSAKNVIAALDQEKYEIVLIGIDKGGAWHLRDTSAYLAFADDPKQIQFAGEKTCVALVPKKDGKELVCYTNDLLQHSLNLDVVFPVLHGTYGEDGTIQGLLQLANIPFVGAGVLGSAIGMDKDVMKRLLRDAGIPIARFVVVRSFSEKSFEEIVAQVGLPCFIKPANLGSSVGISKVKDEEEFGRALRFAFEYDRKVLIEESIEGREIECSVLGNEEAIASLPGEVIPTHEFYSYEAKYLDAKGANFNIPVALPLEKVEEIQKLAVAAYHVLCCEGMARVDFFLKQTGELVVNEINTIPGFTSISMYPKLWEVSGMGYSQLLDRLIALALDRHHRVSSLKTTL